jgi:N-acetylglucosaminyldiphosphoundecaprenol N-acetyl-beta-D-mannosaminyltransferase
MTQVATARAAHRSVDILGCPFDAIDMEETEQFIRAAVARQIQVHITVGNVDMVMKARKDPQLARAFRDSQLTIVDGVPITWAAAFLKRPVKGRVCGTDVVWRCADISRDLHCGVALVGGGPDIAERAAKNLRSQHPGAILNVVPTPFPLTAEADKEVVRRIRANGDRIVLVALGAPRQELWLKEHLAATGANVGIGIGAAFDIISGNKPQAPEWMRRNGLEWLHRMRLEPRRLGRRYFIDDMPFFWHLLKERVRPSYHADIQESRPPTEPRRDFFEASP